MFGLGFSEMVIIMIVLLVLIKPKDLPRITRKVGKIYGTIVKQLNVTKKVFKNFESELETISNIDDNEKKEE